MDKGARNVEILKQREGNPYPVEKQIAIIYCGTKNLLKEVNIKKVKDFEEEYLSILEAQHKDVLNNLRDGKLTDEVIQVLEKLAADLSPKYK